ncbi:MAG: Veg family protein [Clostridiales bacterium]|nr:Veg family protein [Clostridiales bacterium]
MISKSDLNQVKKDIAAYVGYKIQLKSNKGRRSSFVQEGVLENTYPSIFIVKFENDYEVTRRVSFSYTDILTNSVEIKICNSSTKAHVS